MNNLNPPNEPSPEMLNRVAKGLFRFIQVVGITIRKCGRRGVLEEHLYQTLEPTPSRKDFDSLIHSFIQAGLVDRQPGTGQRSAVLYWVGPNQKKGPI